MLSHAKFIKCVGDGSQLRDASLKMIEYKRLIQIVSGASLLEYARKQSLRWHRLSLAPEPDSVWESVSPHVPCKGLFVTRAMRFQVSFEPFNYAE